MSSHNEYSAMMRMIIITLVLPTVGRRRGWVAGAEVRLRRSRRQTHRCSWATHGLRGRLRPTARGQFLPLVVLDISGNIIGKIIEKLAILEKWLITHRCLHRWTSKAACTDPTWPAWTQRHSSNTAASRIFHYFSSKLYVFSDAVWVWEVNDARCVKDVL